MYKKLSFSQLCSINSKFFDNLKKIYKTQRYTFLKEFLKAVFSDWYSVYFFESNEIIFRILKEGDYIIFTDEREKIELSASPDDLNSMHNLLKDDKKVSKINDNNKTILETLIEEFLEDWENRYINWKPFLVYDIETVWNINNLRSMRFMMWYCVVSDEEQWEDVKYKYIEEANLNKFLDFMLEFDWYIVGYNNIYFDNPVCVYASWVDESKIKMLNEKSLDLFLFIWNLTGRRLWLDKVATALVWVSKTLSSWQEWSNLLDEYIKTNDSKILNKVKNYCKNDVRMTLWVLLYFLKYQKLYMDWEERDYTIDQMVLLWSKERGSDKKEAKKEKVIEWGFFS